MGCCTWNLVTVVIYAVWLFGKSKVDALQIWRAPPTSASCTSDVPFADTADCTSYYQCFRVNGVWNLVHLTCGAAGSVGHWDDMYKACVEGACSVVITPAPSSSSTTTTRLPPPPVISSARPPSGYPCAQPGFYPDPANCQYYYQCVLVRGRMYQYPYMCPVGSVWKSRCVVGTKC